MFTGVDFYPIQYYQMFSEIHKQPHELSFQPFVITQENTILKYPDEFDIWPINPVVFQFNLRKFFVSQWTENEKDSFAKEMLLFIKKKYPNKNIKCFGLSKETLNLAELEKTRLHDVTSEEVLRFCQ